MTLEAWLFLYFTGLFLSLVVATAEPNESRFLPLAVIFWPLTLLLILLCAPFIKER